MSLLGRIFKKENLSLKHVFALFSFIFIIWSFYRYFPQIFPLWVEELVLKPIVWVLPVFLLVKKVERKGLVSLGLIKTNVFPSIYWGIGLGLVFAFEGLVTNIFKYKGLHLAALEYSFFIFLGLLGISLVTAFSEELVFRGYIFNRLWQIWNKEWLANIVSSLLFVTIHLPIGIFVLGYTPMVMFAYLFFVFIFGFGSAFVFGRTKNLISSVLLHIFWSWPIILFR